MKCRYKFRVVSDISLNPEIKFSYEGLTYFLNNENNRFTWIIIEATGIDVKSRQPPPEILKEGLPTFSAPDDPMLEYVRHSLLVARGALGVWGIYDIDVLRPQMEWIPENDEEKRNCSIYGLSINHTPRGHGKLHNAPQDLIVRTLISHHKLTEYEIPLEFFRRATDDIYNERYIEAIYDLYFMLEYLFSDGNFKKRSTEDSFNNSHELLAAIEKAKKHPSPWVYSRPKLLKQYNEKYSNLSANGFITKIIECRGFLHHQSSKRNDNWNPSWQYDFELDATVMFTICMNLATEFTTAPLFKPEELKHFYDTQVFTIKGERIQWKPFTPSSWAKFCSEE
jgi:hypothetical protein